MTEPSTQPTIAANRYQTVGRDALTENGHWSAQLSDEGEHVYLTHAWNTYKTADPTRPARERGEYCRATCSFSLDAFAAECPAWLLEQEAADVAPLVWRWLCDRIADELSAREQVRIAREEGGSDASV